MIKTSSSHSFKKGDVISFSGLRKPLDHLNKTFKITKIEEKKNEGK